MTCVLSLDIYLFLILRVVGKVGMSMVRGGEAGMGVGVDCKVECGGGGW